MNMNLLPVLVALLEERHVTRAGDRIGLSQPATSNALSRLRRVLDDELLIRDGNTMRLTQRAIELREQLTPVLASLGRILDNGGRFDPSVASGTVRVACEDHIAMLIVPSLRMMLEHSSPGLSLRVLASAPSEHSRLLTQDQADVVIGSETNDLPAELHSELLFEDVPVCLFRSGHPLDTSRRRSEPLSGESLCSHGALMVGSERDRPTSAPALRQVCEVSSHLLVPYVLRDGDLIAVVGRIEATGFDTAGLVQRPLDADEFPPTPNSMVWHSRTDQSPLHAWVRAAITEISGDIGQPQPPLQLVAEVSS